MTSLLLGLSLIGAVSCRKEHKFSLEEWVAVRYLEAWQSRDYDAMWEQIHHEPETNWWPQQSSQEEFNQAMERFPIPLRKPKLKASHVQKDGTVIVDYSVEAPALGCLSLILLRETDVRVYPYLLSEVVDSSYQKYDFSLEIKHKAGGPLIDFDSTDFYAPVDALHTGVTGRGPGRVMFEPGDALFATVNTIWLYKHKAKTEEWMKQRRLEAENCYQGKTLTYPVE